MSDEKTQIEKQVNEPSYYLGYSRGHVIGLKEGIIYGITIVVMSEVIMLLITAAILKLRA